MRVVDASEALPTPVFEGPILRWVGVAVLSGWWVAAWVVGGLVRSLPGLLCGWRPGSTAGCLAVRGDTWMGWLVGCGLKGHQSRYS